MRPGVPQRRRHLLGEVVHLRRPGAGAPEGAVDVVDLALEGDEARRVSIRRWRIRRAEKPQMAHDNLPLSRAGGPLTKTTGGPGNSTGVVGARTALANKK